MLTHMHKDRKPTPDPVALHFSHLEEPSDLISRSDSEDDREDSEAAPSDHAFSPPTQVSDDLPISLSEDLKSCGDI